MSDVVESTPTPEVVEVSDNSTEVSDESVENLEETVEASEESPIEEAVQEFKKKLRLKIDGQEIEEELDWNDEDRLKRALQKEKAFDKRSQEFATLQKKVGEFVNGLKGNTFETLSQLGIDVEELVTEYAKRAVEESEKDPETKAREAMEKELQALREEKERIKKEKESAELERMKNEHANKIQADILDSLDKSDTVLPKKNPWVITKVAEAMYFAAKNGYPNVMPKDVIPYVEKQYKQDLKSMFDVLPEDVLEQVVGQNNFDRIRKKRVKNRQVKTETANQLVQQTNNKAKTDAEKEKEKQTYKDFFSYR